jgi:hypothetical protein
MLLPFKISVASFCPFGVGIGTHFSGVRFGKFSVKLNTEELEFCEKLSFRFQFIKLDSKFKIFEIC